MRSITLIDPKGVKRLVPLDHAQAALQAGAQYATPQDKQMAMQYGPEATKPKTGLEMILQGLKNAGKQIPTGIKEGVQTGYAGITGGQFTPSPVPDEYGASLGRGTGEMIGQGAMALPPIIAGGLIAGPVGATIGAGIGAGATTPGGVPERGIAAAEAMALPVAGKLLKGAGRHIAKIPAEIQALFSKPQVEKALQIANARHDSLNSTASQLFNRARDEMKARGVTAVEPKSEIISQIERFLPKTEDHQQLFDKAKAGDPDALHDLQSFLWKKGNKALQNTDPAISNRGEEMMSLRDQLNKDVQSKLTQQGHTDVVHSYKLGQKLYKELKDTYYKNKKIAKVFDPESKHIPKDITNYFDENSKAMNDFLKSHPELKEEVMKSKQKREALKKLNRTATTVGVGGGLLYGGEKASHLLDHE